MLNCGDAAGGNHDARGGQHSRSNRPARCQRLLFEELETRNLMSADAATADLSAIMAHTQVTALGTNFTAPVGYTPAQIAAAYGFNQIKFGNVVGNGAGQTIAIVDAYDDPNIANDLATFDKQFGLAAPKFTEVKQTLNGKGPLTNPGWDMEISLDVEWAHAMAPAANIELIEAYTPSLGNLLTCVQYAAAQPGVSVVSMSWGASEFSSEASYNSYFTTPAGHTGVSFVASSGDSGAGALWPAISTNVLSVGGTSLSINKNGTYSSESAWAGSGGGPSSYQTEASYEKGVQTTGKQMDPDVAYDANPNTGFAVYDSVNYEGYQGWEEIGGTSAGAPQWSALIAIANQGRVLDHENTLTNAAAAAFAISPSDFHDVTTGSDGGHSAGKGYDEVTGLGTPQANLVAQAFLNVTAAQQTYTSVAAATTAKTSTSVSSKFDLGGSDDVSSLLIVGVAFSETQALGPANAAARSAMLINQTVGNLTTGGRLTAPAIASTGSARSLAGSSGGDVADNLNAQSSAADAIPGLASTGGLGWSGTGGDEAIQRIDASLAADTEWASEDWIDGRYTAGTVVSLENSASSPVAAPDDAEAQQLTAVLLVIGATLTTLRMSDEKANVVATHEPSACGPVGD